MNREKEVKAYLEGKLAPMYVFGGIDAQKERLENEGVVVDGDKVDLKKYLWR